VPVEISHILINGVTVQVEYWTGICPVIRLIGSLRVGSAEIPAK